MGGRGKEPGGNPSQSGEKSPPQSDGRKSDEERISSSSEPEVGSDYSHRECEDISCTKQARFVVSTEAHTKGEKASSVTEAFETETVFVCRMHSKNKSINGKKVLEVNPWDGKEEELGEEVGSIADLDRALGGKPSPLSEMDAQVISSDEDFPQQCEIKNCQEATEWHVTHQGSGVSTVRRYVCNTHTNIQFEN